MSEAAHMTNRDKSEASISLQLDPMEKKLSFLTGHLSQRHQNGIEI